MSKTLLLISCLVALSVEQNSPFLVRQIQDEVQCQRLTPRDKRHNATYSPYILNGQPADIRNYPFKLSLHIFDIFECGASVISFKWSLTAGHCLESKFAAEFITLLGGTANRVTGGHKFNVQEYFIHPGYNSVILDNDVAVIKIRGTFFGYPFIRPVMLANEACQTLPGSIVKLAGWGMNENGQFPLDLYEIQQQIIDNDSCYLAWQGDITDRMMCAAVDNEIDSCSGDSGGAVIRYGCLQVGIISFGSNICGYPIPSVFTRIENPSIRGFIRSYTGF